MSDSARRCGYPQCGSWPGAIKHKRGSEFFEHEFDATEEPCWCGAPKLSTAHHPKFGTHDYGEPVTRPQTFGAGNGQAAAFARLTAPEPEVEVIVLPDGFCVKCQMFSTLPDKCDA